MRNPFRNKAILDTDNDGLQRSVGPDDDITPYQSYQDPLEPQSQHGESSVSTAVTGENVMTGDRELLRSTQRGFSTSITDSFVWEENERVDCCALTCFGILQSDRDRYLLTGTMPPSLCRRVWIHMGFPLAMFLTAGFCAFNIPNVYWNQMACTFLVTFMVSYLVLQCCKGKWKRSRVRQELLWRLHQVRLDATQNPNAVSDFDYEQLDPDQLPSGPAPAPQQMSARNFMNGQSSRDVESAHAMAGCYGTDVPKVNHGADKDTNLCRCLWQAWQKSCCGQLCGCHVQFCGMCALAQEGRELERLLPSSRRRIDYITMQPMMQYYPKILMLRKERNGSLAQHYQSTSRLARILLLYLSMFFVAALVLSLLPRAARGFRLNNFMVLLATFGQAFVLLYALHWYWHRFDLSLDAVIKYFASGFLLSSSLAVTWEILCSLLIRLVVEIGMALSGVDETSENEYGGTSTKEEVPLPEIGGIRYNDRLLTESSSASVHDYMLEFGRDHFFIYTLFLFVDAFIIAAMIEELCKYFGYRMVDHPDFLSKKELHKAADAPMVTGNHGNAMDLAVEQVMSSVDAAVESGSITTTNNNDGAAVSPTNSAAALPDLMDAQTKTHRSHAAAITIAMVAVAIGFSCCENLVYVFVYNSSSLGTEIMVLLNRALLPVHPISAALMSLGLCRRVVEKDKKMTLGRIILPSVVFHGTFDFGLLLLDFWDGIGGEEAVQNSKDKLVAALSYAFAFFCIMAGLVYYYKESLKQRQRLSALDMDNSDSMGTNNNNNINVEDESNDEARILS